MFSIFCTKKIIKFLIKLIKNYKRGECEQKKRIHKPFLDSGSACLVLGVVAGGFCCCCLGGEVKKSPSSSSSVSNKDDLGLAKDEVVVVVMTGAVV